MKNQVTIFDLLRSKAPLAMKEARDNQAKWLDCYDLAVSFGWIAGPICLAVFCGALVSAAFFGTNFLVSGLVMLLVVAFACGLGPIVSRDGWVSQKLRAAKQQYDDVYADLVINGVWAYTVAAINYASPGTYLVIFYHRETGAVYPFVAQAGQVSELETFLTRCQIEEIFLVPFVASILDKPRYLGLEFSNLLAQFREATDWNLQLRAVRIPDALVELAAQASHDAEVSAQRLGAA